MRCAVIFAVLACACDAELPVEDSPQWHWVLRDADGQPVKAVIDGISGGPSCGWDGVLYTECAARIGRGSAVDDFPCVDLAWIGGLRLHGSYELANGRPERCYSQAFLSEMTHAELNALPNPPYELTLEP